MQRPPRRALLRPIMLGLSALIVLAFGLFSFLGSSAKEVSFSPAPTATSFNQLDKEEIRGILDEESFSQLTNGNLLLTEGGSTLQVETTLYPDLQEYLLDTIDRVNSRHVGIVVMEGKSGRVLALAGFDRIDALANPCLRSQFPAASIFKIVTAVTAMDHCGYSSNTPMHYNGAKHTLYKRQLTDKVDRYTTTIPLREAFADSINPVFGKLGELRLRKPLLEQAAATFGFNHPLDFEVALPPSQFLISDQPYNWAEVASGFNRGTTLSPLHGAALVTTVLNGGRMVTPTIVERITNEQEQILYLRPEAAESRQIMSARAATELGQMMENTITTGTARKVFRKHKTDKILAPLQIGGKTGSLDNATHDVRYDWFVGFAKDRRSSKQMVVAVMVGHEKFIGIRASDYARRAMTYYFSNPTGLPGSNAAASKTSPPVRQI
ncbi:MAG: penicillin-binding transpeptidase domain-containing protein [Desulfuromonadales bacterium]|nr:penicillin-binding transpeptidase domain-containing protein [Desulfuromonadales bacterium]